MKHLQTNVTLLLVLTCCTSEADRNRMRAGLNDIDQRNRSGQPFTASEVQPYVQFFDEHGTPNDQLLAHYLLGRAYYEHGEAPMALQCYHDAIDCVDTTDEENCDFSQLSRVFAQMGNIFYYQGLYRKQLECQQKAMHYAWIGKDVLAALMSYEQESFAYNGLGMYDSAIFVIEDVAAKYEQHGYPSDAAISLGVNIRPLIDRGDYDKAKHCMDIYESKSGLFDASGNIAKGREVYYNVKGFYYLYINKLDSAEYYFRKEMHDGKDYNNQHAGAKGLSELYQILNMSDSMAKYYRYAYVMNDSAYTQKTTKEIRRMQAMYDYTRHQEEAYRERNKAHQRTIVIWICIVMIAIICLVTYNIIRELSRKRCDAERKYIDSQTAIEQARHDIASLRLREDINKELISEKEQIIHEQETIMKSLLRRDSNSQSMADRRLMATDIYQRFEQLSAKGQQPTDEEWEQLKQQIFLCYPGFKDFLSKHETINDKEYKTCLLVRVGFKPTNIGSMLEVSSSYMTELRTKMLQKLFKMSGTSKSFDKLLREIY